MTINRKQRRKQEKEERNKRKSMVLGGFCTVSKELAPMINDGDKFTIARFQRLSDGTYNDNCNPGDETVFTAVVGE